MSQERRKFSRQFKADAAQFVIGAGFLVAEVAEGRKIHKCTLISRATGRDPATISWEFRRNAATRGHATEHPACDAQWQTGLAAKCLQDTSLVADPRLHNYVQERLASGIFTDDETIVFEPHSRQLT
jgi:IS30 family transposase